MGYIENSVKASGFESMPESTPVLTVHANYASGDYCGTSGVAMEFQKSASGPGKSGYILSALLIDAALQSAAIELWLYDYPVTPPADSAAWTLSDSDAKHLVAIIPFSNYYASALNSVSDGQPDTGPKKFVCQSDSRSLYGCLVLRSAPTFSSGDLTVRLTLEQG